MLKLFGPYCFQTGMKLDKRTSFIQNGTVFRSVAFWSGTKAPACGTLINKVSCRSKGKLRWRRLVGTVTRKDPNFFFPWFHPFKFTANESSPTHFISRKKRPFFCGKLEVIHISSYSFRSDNIWRYQFQSSVKIVRQSQSLLKRSTKMLRKVRSKPSFAATKFEFCTPLPNFTHFIGLSHKPGNITTRLKLWEPVLNLIIVLQQARDKIGRYIPTKAGTHFKPVITDLPYVRTV